MPLLCCLCAESSWSELYPDPQKILLTFDAANRERLAKKAPRALLQSLAVHELSLFLLASVEENDILIRRNQHGCPIVIREDGQPSRWHLSCSHTDRMAVAALSNSPVGVDVEPVRPWNSKISRRMFQDEENEWISQSPDPNLSFTQVWTLRECYGKLCGTGLGRMPKVSVISGGKGIACSDTNCSSWSGMVQGMVVSCVWRGSDKLEWVPFQR